MREKFALFDADQSGELSADELDAQSEPVAKSCMFSRVGCASQEGVLKSLGITPSRHLAASSFGLLWCIGVSMCGPFCPEPGT